MADYEQETKARIIDSVIKRRNTTGESQEEVYVAHLKIWETENGQDKLRYIILSGVFVYSPTILFHSDLRTQRSMEAIPYCTSLASIRMELSQLVRRGN